MTQFICPLLVTSKARETGEPLSLPNHKEEIKFLYDDQKLTEEEIAEKTEVSRYKVYKAIKN